MRSIRRYRCARLYNVPRHRREQADWRTARGSRCVPRNRVCWTSTGVTPASDGTILISDMRLVLVAAFALFGMLSLLAGCGSGDNPPATDGSTQVAGTPTPTAVDQDDVSLPRGMSMQEFQGLLDNANDFVLPIIRDGHVRPSEYEAAVLRVLSCLDDAGIPHSDPKLKETRNGPRWYYSVGPSSDEEVEENSRIHDQCDMDYLRPVLSVWIYQEQPSVTEQEEYDQRFLQCLSKKGIDADSVEEADLKRREGLLSGEQQADYIECLSETG